MKIYRYICQKIANYYFYKWLNTDNINYLDKYEFWIDNKWRFNHD